MKTDQPISIWVPENSPEGIIFRRPKVLPLGDHYADRESFQKIKTAGTMRICYFGESAAAGYLYAPHFTPAKALQKLLNCNSKEISWEVIDLSMTNETLAGLDQKVEESMQVQPDIIVIYTGNNWNLLEFPEHSPYFPSVSNRKVFGATFAKHGILGGADRSWEMIIQHASEYFLKIAVKAKKAGIKVVLVVPEVNLRDWENKQPVSWLPGEKVDLWHSHYRKAMKAVGELDWDIVQEQALKMLDLDEATCPSSFRFLYSSLAAKGHLEEAKEAATAEVDSNYGTSQAFLASPQANSLVKSFLRTIARNEGFGIVDLPEIMAEKHHIPGREYFLDYCHLTSEGIRLMVRHICEKIFKQAGLSGLANKEKIQKEADKAIVVSPEVEATARFGAAIHTAHRMLPITKGNSIIRYWIKGALDICPDISHVMFSFISARQSRGKVFLAEAQQEILSSPFPLGMAHGWDYHFPDTELLMCIQEVLTERGNQTNHGLEPNKNSERKDQWQLWQPLEQLFTELQDSRYRFKRTFYRAFWPQTTLSLFKGRKSDLKFRLCLRLPQNGDTETGEKEVRIVVNGQILGKFKLGSSWQVFPLKIPSSLSVQGINQLTIFWPESGAVGDQAIEGIIGKLGIGQEVCIHPVFGEIAFEV